MDRAQTYPEPRFENNTAAFFDADSRSRWLDKGRPVPLAVTRHVEAGQGCSSRKKNQGWAEF